MCVGITPDPGLAEYDHVGEQSQRYEDCRCEQQLGELQHGIPPSSPSDSEGTARSHGSIAARPFV